MKKNAEKLSPVELNIIYKSLYGRNQEFYYFAFCSYFPIETLISAVKESFAERTLCRQVERDYIKRARGLITGRWISRPK